MPVPRADPLGQRRGRMEGEDKAAARFRVQAIGELRFHSRALEEEREWTQVGGEVIGHAGAVLLGLCLHAGQREPFGLGLDNADGLLVDVEEVVGAAVARLEGELTHRHPTAGVQIEGVSVLDRPPRLLQPPIYVFASFLFRRHLARIEGYTLLRASTAIRPSLNVSASFHELVKPLFVVEQHPVALHPSVIVSQGRRAEPSGTSRRAPEMAALSAMVYPAADDRSHRSGGPVRARGRRAFLP